MEPRRWLALLCWLFSVYGFGLLFFCRGFLLNRHALLLKSSCADVLHPEPFSGGQVYGFGLLFFCRGFLLNRHALLLKSSCADVLHPEPFSGGQVYGFGLLFFCRGFLLNRHALLLKSSCADVLHPEPFSGGQVYGFGLLFFCRGFLLNRHALLLKSSCADVLHPEPFSGGQVYGFGLLFFCRGFLLNRHALLLKSSCADVLHPEPFSGGQVYGFGLLFFCRGFLLNRHALLLKSSCADVLHPEPFSGGQVYGFGLLFFCRGFLLNHHALLLKSSCADVLHPEPFSGGQVYGFGLLFFCRGFLLNHHALLLKSSCADVLHPEPFSGGQVYGFGLLFFCRGFLLNRHALLLKSSCADVLHPEPFSGGQVYGFGLLFFCRGFLLNHHALLLKSSCADVLHPEPFSSGQEAGPDGCWVPARFKRVVLVIIDALRYDFAAPNLAPDVPYHGRLQTVKWALQERPQHSLLYRFIADAPTTTLQRIKGLTTGSLPTFIDAGSNFAGSVIDEDNLIYQLTSRNKSAVMLGDDTWSALFPDQFIRSYPFPSFDVKDLHTVDNGVLSNIWNELPKDDWTLLVAHFLGVDHCGHKFGPNHPEMSGKLEQMDAFLSNLTSELSPDTLLVVAGDHGMTSTGDHGGDSRDELNAALFLYSKAMDPLHQRTKNFGDKVKQIDLVPTLSLLLDSPIPFSSLGSVFTDLFRHDDAAFLRAAKANAWQVARYAENYQKFLRDGAVAERLKGILKVLYSLDESELTAERCLELIQSIHAVFEGSWAKFHFGWVSVGLLVLADNFLFSVLLLLRAAAERPLCLKSVVVGMKLGVWALMLASLWVEHEAVPPIIGICTALQVALVIHCMASELLCIVIPVSGNQIIIVIFVLLSGLGLFSNSYAVLEGAVLRFLAASAVLATLIMHFKPLDSLQKRKLSRKGVSRWTRLREFVAEGFGGVGPLAWALLTLLCLRLGALAGRCREEQEPCTPSLLSLPFASLGEERMPRFAAAVMAAVLTSYAYRRLMRPELGAPILPAYVLRFVGPTVTVITCVTWTGQWLPEKALTNFAYIFQLGLPQGAYLMLLLALAVTWMSPLFTWRMKRGDLTSGPQPLFPGSELDQSDVYRHFRAHANEYLSSKDEEELILGTRRCVEVPLLGQLWLWSLLLGLLLGDGMAAPLLAFLLLLTGLLTLASDSGTGAAALLTLASGAGFYGLGHEAVFSAIPWDAAFLGFPGDFRFQSLQALPVILNITASYILCALAVPLTSLGEVDAGDVQLLRRHPDAVYLQILRYATLIALRVICAAGAASLHCRHLMVWKIFAPRFVYEGIGFLAGLVTLLITAAFYGRVARAARRELRL